MGYVPPIYKDVDFESFINSPDVKKFLGKYYDYYSALWRKDLEKKKGKLVQVGSCFHWNWLAFFMAPAWFGYHKMWSAALTFTGILCSLFFAEAIFNFDAGTTGTASMGLVITLLSKGLYFAHVMTFFYKNKELPAAELSKKIEKQGGTSVSMAIICCVLYFVAVLGSLFLSDMLFGHPMFAEE